MDGGGGAEAGTRAPVGAAQEPAAAGPVSITFTSDGDLATLTRCLEQLQKSNARLLHIESRPSRDAEHALDYLVQLDAANGSVTDALDGLRGVVRSCAIQQSAETEPWFPRSIADLDRFANRVLSGGAELQADHPGFTDEVYRARRQHFADIANNYKHGQPIPLVEYTEAEKATWKEVFAKLAALHKTNACKEFNAVFPQLEQHCGYGADNVPQLQDISRFLKGRTGFSMRPVAGLLSSRDFLAGLAFRVFFSTQYIRHGSKPLYTPEPDICHELLGHVPLLADPAFAQFSQELGLASLGASDAYVERLATLYWYTVEFGLCRQDGQLKAYGAGLLSSFGELEYCLTDEPEKRPFLPDSACDQPYPITRYQPIYYVAESFADAKDKLRAWAAKIPRSFTCRYNPNTQTVDILHSDNKEGLLNCVADIRSNLEVLEDAMKKRMS